MRPSTETLPALLSPEVAADPQRFYRRLRAEYPVHYDASVGSYLVTRHADVKAGYRNPAFTTKNYEWQLQPVFGRGLLQMDGKEHARKRSLVSPHFRGRGAQKWEPVIASNCARLVEGLVASTVDALAEGLRPGVEVDLCSRFAHRLPISVIADVLGLPDSDLDRFFAWYTAMIDFLSNLAKDPEVSDRGIRAKVEFDEYIAPTIRRRRADPGEDLISDMCVAEVDGERLDDEEVRTHVTQLLVAGAETTANTIGNLFRNLLEHRDQFEAVRDDRSLIPSALSETLRFTPPSQMNARVLDDTVRVAGEELPAGSTVTLVIASANRDERRFSRPDEFDIHRADMDHEQAFSGGADHFAFGSGRHFCLGAMLGKAELETSMSALLDRFPGMRLAEGFVPRERGVKMRGVEELRVVL